MVLRTTEEKRQGHIFFLLRAILGVVMGPSRDIPGAAAGV